MTKARILGCVLGVAGLVGCGGGGATSDAGSTPGSDGGPGNDSSVPGTDGGPGSDSGTSPGGFHCTTASLFSGFPVFDADPGVHANEGDPLAGVEGRPLGWRKVAFVGTHLVTVVGQEVWTSDLSEASPTVHRLAGLDSAGQSLADGPCASARFANLQDVVAGSDGSLFVMDQTANAVLHITHPFEASCNVEYWAGTSVDTTDITPDSPPNVGNTEGPGASAQFALPGRMAIDASDNLYVWDEGNSAIRKIASDAAHTVSTLAPLASGTHDVHAEGMVVLGSALYVVQTDTGGDVFLEAMTLATGAKTELFRGRADLFGFSSSDSIQVGGLTTDGTDLLLYFKGGVYAVTTSGAITRVAGDENLRSTIDFDPGYDPMVSHPALEAQLANRSQYATAGADSWLVWDGSGHLYFVGEVNDPYVERIDCTR